jgi:3'-phosphoadenosine 5'-phosphosulfate sulfotransferase (PAPS reductase)/FAD synthetase
LIDKKKALPNVMMRFCTIELKIRPAARWMAAQFYDEWTVLVGLRYDEPSRVARIRVPNPREKFTRDAPLYDAKITKEDVLAFWASQPFDLALGPHESNCDLCFLKGTSKRLSVLQQDPSRADWWIEQEKRTGQFFINPKKEPCGYEGLKSLVVRRLPVISSDSDLSVDPSDNSIDCACTD